ncbi:hypothetical protein L3X39_08010 [Sabulilitoribacter multivorans]|uniref:Uncharacterized protein n=1 Tax=Flaviramulus multivorans TaxID=1304750 RepID=A0ABS9IIP8_9FLAO|nr:hypothetical protein [Flaviramulus multivorans]MCF7560579.1 hypothetical protein [Flaviramulus multivorans]
MKHRKLKKVFKIVLSVSSIVITGLMILGLYTSLSIRNSTLSYAFYVSLTYCFAGVLSIIYHFKTLKFYNKEQEKQHSIDLPIWVSNVIFSLLLIYFSISTGYSFYKINEEAISNATLVIYAFCLIFLLIGLCLIIEQRYLYLDIKKNKNQSRKDSIDDIKGHRDDEV